MSDTADLEGKVTRLDVEGLETWFGRMERMAEMVGESLADPPDGATTVVGKDGRMFAARRFGRRHSVALDRARQITGELAHEMHKIRRAGHDVIDGHTVVDNGVGLDIATIHD